MHSCRVIGGKNNETGRDCLKETTWSHSHGKDYKWFPKAAAIPRRGEIVENIKKDSKMVF